MTTLLNAFILVEPRLLPIPQEIETKQDYGQETVVGENGQILATGEVTWVKGSLKSFEDWLGDKGIVWVSSVPVIGLWNPSTVKKRTTNENDPGQETQGGPGADS